MSEPRPRPLAALAGFAALVTACAVLLAVVATTTRPHIEANRTRQLSAALVELTGRQLSAAGVNWDNDSAVLCNGLVVLRGAAAGYAGDIRWLAAADLRDDGVTLRAVRIVAHQETPGIADFLDRPQTGWLGTLPGRDAAALAAADTVSGATITTRALRRDLGAALSRAPPGAATAECAP